MIWLVGFHHTTDRDAFVGFARDAPMAIVSRAVATSPFTPRFGKPTHSQGVVTLRGQQTEWLQGLADPAGSIGCFSSHDKESIP